MKSVSRSKGEARGIKRIDLAYVVDGGEPRATTAKAVSNHQALMGFGDDGVRFKEFSRGYQLRVAAADQVFTFDLTDTAKLLPALLNCVTQQTNPTPVMASRADRPLVGGRRLYAQTGQARRVG